MNTPIDWNPIVAPVVYHNSKPFVLDPKTADPSPTAGSNSTTNLLK